MDCEFFGGTVGADNDEVLQLRQRLANAERLLLAQRLGKGGDPKTGNKRLSELPLEAPSAEQRQDEQEFRRQEALRQAEADKDNRLKQINKELELAQATQYQHLQQGAEEEQQRAEAAASGAAATEMQEDQQGL